MSQPLATLYIQPPMFDTTVAIQISVNALWRNGAHAEGAGSRCEMLDGALTVLRSIRRRLAAHVS